MEKLLDLLSLIFISMSMPLSIICFLRFKNTPYGKVIQGFMLFNLSSLIYVAGYVTDAFLCGVNIRDIGEFFSSMSIFYTSLLMIKTFIR